MGEKKISTLWILVDLSCEKCNSKIKQVLCKYDCQIISKTFDEKKNLVIVTGYFHPCKFSKKLRCKAGKAIISIEEKKDEPEPEPAPPPPPPPAPPAPAPDNPPPVVVVVVEVTPPPPAPEPEPAPPVPEPEPSPVPATEPEPAPVATPKEPEPQPQPQMVVPYFIPTYPPPQFGVCCGPCYEGYGGGPCEHQGYGRPVVPPPPAYEYDYYGRRSAVQPLCDCGCGSGYRRCQTPCDYICEEDPNKCSIM